MTPEQIKARAPIAWRAYELTLAGNDRRATGKIMGISRHTVSTHVNRVRKWLAESEQTGGPGPYATLLEATTATRCRCGLMLPHECLASIWQVAASRSGASAGDF